MREKIVHIVCFLLALILCIPGADAIGRADLAENPVIRVGLAYGSGTVAATQLENKVGVGFQFGITDAAGVFTALAATDQTKITLRGSTEVGAGPLAVTVLATGSETVLYQFDGTVNPCLTVRPQSDPAQKAVTLCRVGKSKDYQYFGDFRYERLDGGNLTVVNLVPLEDYIKGVIPYEMSSSWPIEALKAQTLCARTYTICNLNRHKKYHFDLCNTTDCQVYFGTGSANETTDRAVDETRGQYVFYDGALASTYYFSCDGGATEDSQNVWVTALPYLKGVVDPYEASAIGNNKNYYNWTVTYTKEDLRQRLIKKGYTKCGEIAKFYVSKRTPTDNVYSVTFEDVNGTAYTISKDSVRTTLGLQSIRFTVAEGTGGTPGHYCVNDGATLPDTTGAYAISGQGTVAAIDGPAYAITGKGTAPLTPSGATASEQYTITGSGNGHQVGMSQWGAYAMAKQGFTYEDILKFYFTGIEIS